jgi:hypothetical protein
VSIETDLYTTLSGNAGVTAICSTRIYPNLAPETASNPLIVYSLVTGNNISTITGVGDMERKRIQINCNADTYAEAKSLASAVQTALAGDGYLEFQFDQYDPQSQCHTVYVDWSFLA